MVKRTKIFAKEMESEKLEKYLGSRNDRTWRLDVGDEEEAGVKYDF